MEKYRTEKRSRMDGRNRMEGRSRWKGEVDGGEKQMEERIRIEEMSGIR